MKLFHYLSSMLLIGISCLMGSCDDNENTLSKAVLTSASSLHFEARQAAEQIITVYADADWIMEDVPAWVQVNPSTGTGTMDVMISTTDNLREGTLDNPRKTTILFRGATLASRASVVISQEGDKYRDCQEYTVNQLPELADETIVSVPEALVVAVTTTGCVVTDAQYQTNILLQTVQNVHIGDIVSIKGSKLSDTRKLTYLACDEVSVISKDNAVTRPEPHDISGEIDTYTSHRRDWITVSGILDGTTLTIEGAKNQVAISDAPASLGLDKLNGHRICVNGYYHGTAAPVLRIIAAEIKDLGVVEEIYFSEDFEWLNPWSIHSQAGQTVEHDGDGAAPQVYTAKNESGITAAEALTQRGYLLEQTPGNAIYLQKNYLKFGKTDYQAGITLPAIDGIPENTPVQLSFDWAPMVGGTRKFDPVQIIVYITNGKQVIELDPLTHTFVDEQDKLSWLHVKIRLEGISITKETRISIKSDAWGENKGNTGSSVYRRWFIDNIKLTKVQ